MFSRRRIEEHAKRRAMERAANMASLVSTAGGRRGTYAGGTSGVAVVKTEPLQHRGYMAAVRELGYCMRCRIACRPQFCHRDQGKGTGIKTDCREGWPGCPECHHLVGSTGYYPKEERRALELDLGKRTRNALRAAGLWPARCPEWKEE